jgi:hypothetical protein
MPNDPTEKPTAHITIFLPPPPLVEARPTMADPFSITISIITLLQIFGEVSGSLKGAHEDYRHAPQQINHALLLRKILESNNTQPSGTSPSQLQEALATAQGALSEISETFPSELVSDTRRVRLWWATGGKRKYQQSLSRLREIESAFTFPIELKQL